MARITLEALNAMPRDAAAAALAGIFEHAPWIADAACAARPYATVAALHERMLAALEDSGAERQLAFIRGHPELGSKVARKDITEESKAEQGSLGLDRLSDEEYERFSRLNAAFRSKFGFPFIVCVRRHTRDSILRQFERRLSNSDAQERAAALAEIAHITRLRLVSILDGPGKPATDGRLTIQAIDLVTGRPAASLKIALYEVGASARGLLATATTNSLGRTDTPLLADGPLRIGTYELHAFVGDYFVRGQTKASGSFFGILPVRFSIAEPEADYHLPLSISPFSYCAGRGR